MVHEITFLVSQVHKLAVKYPLTDIDADDGDVVGADLILQPQIVRLLYHLLARLQWVRILGHHVRHALIGEELEHPIACNHEKPDEGSMS